MSAGHYAGSILSIQSWWGDIAVLQAKLAGPALAAAEAAEAEKSIFMLYLVCIVAAIMLVLVSVIVLDAARRWWEILAGPAPAPQLETAGQ